MTICYLAIRNNTSLQMTSNVAEGEFSPEINALLSDAKQNTSMSSFDTTLRTMFIMRKLVGSTRWSNAEELMQSVKNIGKHLIQLEASENPVLNVVRRILKIIREEYFGTVGNENNGTESLQSTIMANKNYEEDFTKQSHGLKSAIIESMNELVSELETCRENIARQALDYIHNNEIVMTLGYSRTVEKFLKNAARKRKFTVMVAENAPFFDGQKLATSLAENNIATTVITDSAVFAVMARVNKVILGVHLVLADGSVIAANGAQAIGYAAKQHRVPVIACAGLFKLSPTFVCSYRQSNLTKFLSPAAVGDFVQHKTSGKVTVCNPLGDYVNAGFVDLFISDVGGNVPSYLYRLLSEMYHPRDYQL